jgi:hypothetical protein
MIKKVLVLCATALLLTACETPTTQRYAILADNSMAIRSLNASGIGMGSFQPPAEFSENCRALGPLKVADNLSHTQYIQHAFEDELKLAGAYAATPRVSLNGKINKLEFSSSKGLTGGFWAIDMTLASSNGQSMNVNEYYEFNSGFSAPEACRQTAEAFSRAVQNLVGKTVRDPKFVAMVK